MARKIKVFGDLKYLKFLRAGRFKIPYTVMSILPWDKSANYIDGMSAAQLLSIADFAEVAHRTQGLPLHERLNIIRNERLGKDFCREAYGIPSAEVMKRRIEARRKSDTAITSEVSKWRELARAKATPAYA